MQQENLRFRKSSRSASNSNCVEVAHTLAVLRDSKAPIGTAHLTADVRALLRFVRQGD